MDRREFVATVAAGTAVATAGCIGVLTGSEALEREATEAQVAESTLEETDYELEDTSEREVEREFDTPAGTREVRATNQVAEYNRTVQLGVEEVDAAVFAVLATPAFEFAGETFNPIGDMSNREIADSVQGQYEGLSVGDKVEDAEVDSLDQSLTLSKFEGRGTVAGNEVDVYVHVGRFQHEGDFVVPLAVYPQEFSDEESTVVTLIENVEH